MFKCFSAPKAVETIILKYIIHALHEQDLQKPQQKTAYKPQWALTISFVYVSFKKSLCAFRVVTFEVDCIGYSNESCEIPNREQKS